MAKYVLCEVGAVSEGTCKSFIVEGRRIALYNVAGEFYATQDICRHKGGLLGKGTLDGLVVTCPLHGWRFNVRTGDCLTHPHCKRLQLYATSVEEDGVAVELQTS